MKYIICFAALFVVIEASAQTVCLGLNCGLEPPGFSNPGAPGFEGPPFDYDSWRRNSNIQRLFDAEELEQCLRSCNLEFNARVNACAAVYESSLSPLSESNYYACIAWASQRRAECYSPTGWLQCDETSLR